MKGKSYHLFFKALSNKGRIKILELLRYGPTSVGKISKELKMEQSLVSHNLSILKEWGFVSSKKDGKKVYYTIDKSYVLPIFEMLDKYLSRFEKKLCTCGIVKGEKYCKHING